MEFKKFPKMARLSRNCVITEKIDGTNAQIFFDEEGNMKVGSRNRWISTGDDNCGFAKWCYDNEECLQKLGPGRHFGEWWGQGVQRKYGMDHKVFSLFNTARWNKETKPECCSVVPVLFEGIFTSEASERCLDLLKLRGSQASPGFTNPEGIVIYHQAACMGFKKTIDNDGIPKSAQKGK